MGTGGDPNQSLGLLLVGRGGQAGVPGLTMGRLLTAGLERCTTGSTPGEEVGRSVATALFSRSANEWKELPRVPGLPSPPVQVPFSW